MTRAEMMAMGLSAPAAPETYSFRPPEGYQLDQQLIATVTPLLKQAHVRKSMPRLSFHTAQQISQFQAAPQSMPQQDARFNQLERAVLDFASQRHDFDDLEGDILKAIEGKERHRLAIRSRAFRKPTTWRRPSKARGKSRT